LATYQTLVRFNFETLHAKTKRCANISSSGAVALRVASAGAALNEASGLAKGGTRHYRPSMKWSLRVARVSGIDVRVHATFALAVAYFAIGFGASHGTRGAAFGALLICALFACVTLHELGHSLVAQRFGVGVSEILLLPIGGVARLTSEPRKPLHELLIALAGPLVNVVIAFGLFLALVRYAPDSFDLRNLPEFAEPSPLGLVRSLFFGNVMLAIFNMLPALPMDGGRVFRALLSLAIGRSRATRIAAGVGQLIAIGLVVYGLRANSSSSGWLALIGLFVFVGAAQERAAGRASDLLSELRAGEVCDPHALVLAPHEQVGHVLDTLVRSPQAHFAVFYGKELVGTVARDQILAMAPRVGLNAPLASLMRREFFAVDAGTPLDEVRRRLMELGGRPVVVRSLTGFAGVLGFEDLQRITRVAERLAQAGIRRPQVAPDPALH
jgi:Zn-dependent protease